MNPIRIWLLAFRPKTLTAAIAPVLIGTAMAFNHGIHHFPSAGWALLAALAIQIGTNLANDYFDFKKGADTQERVGPTRVTQAGLVTEVQMRIAMILAFAVAALACEMLVLRAGWPIVVIGVLSILSGIFYTAGSKPLGYLGLGDLFVLVFFGPVAVGGTYFVQSLEINTAVLLAGLGPGFISVAILAVNNLRDIEGDAKVGKRTLAVRFGRSFAITEYLVSILIAAMTPVITFIVTGENPWQLIAVLTAFAAIPAVKIVCSRTDGPSLNKALGMTGALLLIYSFLYAGGWVRGLLM